MFISIIVEKIRKNLERLQKSDDFKERKKVIYQVIFWSISGILSLILYIPPGLSIIQISYAIIVFFLIIYFAFRTIKYFKIL